MYQAIPSHTKHTDTWYMGGVTMYRLYRSPIGPIRTVYTEWHDTVRQILTSTIKIKRIESA